MSIPTPCPKCRRGHLEHKPDKRGPGGSRVYECTACTNRVLVQGLKARLRERYRGWIRGIRERR